METTDSMLVDATKKLLQLHNDSEWAKQLPLRCPPVLWFGNTTSSKPKVLTIGANPSRQEFLSDSSEQAMAKVLRPNGQSLLSYLEPPYNRFHLLPTAESMSDVLTFPNVRKQVIASYDGYFLLKPYTTWFGNDRDDSYKVEGFLRGFGASYYNGATVSQQAIHVDLFPFATISDFGQIKAMADESIFADDWAKRLLGRLIEHLAPVALILFGRSNCEYFGSYIDQSIRQLPWQQLNDAGKCFIDRSESFGVPIVGLSTNLGNPKGYKADELRKYGEKIRRLI